MAGAYSATGAAWQHGPGRVYDRLAVELVRRCPAVRGGMVLDVGAGTGAASRAAMAAGARSVVAVDIAHGMLAFDADVRPPAVVGDTLALPLRSSTFDAAVAAFSLNHVPDPEVGLREMARVVRRGGPLVVGSYALDDTHPAKLAVERALRRRGWEPEPWHLAVRDTAMPRLASEDQCMAVALAAGLDARCEQLRVPFPELGAAELVEWRLGMAQHSTFLAGLSAADRQVVAADAIDFLGDRPPVLVRSVMVLTATSPS